MRLALIADWLTVFGGAEHTIEEFLKLWPDAPLFTTVARRGNLGPLDRADIRVSNLQPWFKLLGHHQPLIFRMPKAVEGFDLRGFDVIFSSSHAVAKGVIPPPAAVHVCYCHTPLRYAWEMEDQYLDDFRIPKFLRATVKRKLRELRRWDLMSAKRTDVFIANSSETQRRVSDIYGRESVVVPPPVDDRFFATPLIPSSERTSYLAIGRLVPYKRYDLLIETANKLHLPLKIVGRGQEERRLRALCGPTVEFLGYRSDEELPELYANAKAVLFAAHEDAGIVPLEAQACGTPVIAFGKGGTLDTIKEGETGLFFDQQTVESVSEALTRFAAVTFDAERIREHAEKYSSSRFRQQISQIVEGAVAYRHEAQSPLS